MAPPHPLVQLARDAIRYHLEFRKSLVVSSDLKSKFSAPTGVFVTLFLNEALRGCVGSLQPQTNTLAQEVVRNAVLAGFNDPRYDPVSKKDIEKLDIHIEAITPSEPVEDLSTLDPEVDGLIVRSGKKQGVLLPAIEGVDTVEQQIKICRSKGKIKSSESVTYFRFRVEQHF